MWRDGRVVGRGYGMDWKERGVRERFEWGFLEKCGVEERKSGMEG